MKNITGHIGLIENVKRMESSSNGNPRYSFEIDGHTVCTAVDSSHGYSITNYENKRADVTIGSHYGKLTLNTLRKA